MEYIHQALELLKLSAIVMVFTVIMMVLKIAWESTKRD